MTNPFIDEAKRIVNIFRQIQSPSSPWIQIRERQKIADQLMKRIENPFLINQGTSGTCAPAAIAFEIARANPRDCVLAVAQLYNVGSTTIRKWALRPCRALLKAPCPPEIDEADWVLLASIRDSENWFFDVTSEKDSFASGTRLGEIEE